MTEKHVKTIEGMQQLALARGGVCLSQTYHNLATRLSWRCAAGHEWLADPYRIIRGSWCPVCARLQRRDTLETAQQVAAERGGRCLSTRYESRRVQMEWRCTQGHHWQATFASIQQGSWCPTCFRERKRDTLEKMKEIATQRGGRRLSEAYVDSANALLWECVQGHRWEAVPASVKHRSWCPVCALEKARCTLEEVCSVGGKCLSAE